MKKVVFCIAIVAAFFAASTPALSQTETSYVNWTSNGWIKSDKLHWTDEGYYIRFTLVSDSASGEDWIYRLQSQGKRVNQEVVSVLRSEYFVPTKDTLVFLVVKGDKIASPYRTDTHIREKARGYGAHKPTLEAACLISFYVSKKDMKEMGVNFISIMSEPVPANYSDEDLLLVAGKDFLGWAPAFSGCKWKGSSGFAFLAQ